MHEGGSLPRRGGITDYAKKKQIAYGGGLNLELTWTFCEEALNNIRNPLNKGVLVRVVFDGAVGGAKTGASSLSAGTRPLGFHPRLGCRRLDGASRPGFSRSNYALRHQLALRRKQITQPEQQSQPLRVLRQPLVAHLAVTEQPLQFQEGMLHLGPY